tara:strand:+ start:300 stop:530 length:231 start_codon:yes stop_codon:yes gene_type:complete
MNTLETPELTREERIEDYIVQAFVMGMGTNIPSKKALTYMIDCVKVAVDASGEEITEQYVRDYIPRYIDMLYKQNY